MVLASDAVVFQEPTCGGGLEEFDAEVGLWVGEWGGGGYLGNASLPTRTTRTSTARTRIGTRPTATTAGATAGWPSFGAMAPSTRRLARGTGGSLFPYTRRCVATDTQGLLYALPLITTLDSLGVANGVETIGFQAVPQVFQRWSSSAKTRCPGSRRRSTRRAVAGRPACSGASRTALSSGVCR